MPELDPLPHRPSAPVFRPRTGDFDGVVSRARHRRRRHTGVAGASVVGGVAVAAFVLLGHAQVPYGLRPAQPVASVGGYPTGGHPTAARQPAPGATQPASGAGGGVAPRGTGATTAPPGEGHGPVAVPPAPVGDTAPLRTKPVFVRDDVANDTAVCDSDPSLVTATGWCLRYAWPAVAHLGETTTFRVYACRHIGRGAQTLTFRDDQQVEFTVGTYGRTLWRWSQGWKYPAHRNTVRVAEGRCARWTVTWRTVADDHRPIAPGGYNVNVNVDTNDWGEGPSMSAGMGGDITIAR
jgi:hypothetical protein